MDGRDISILTWNMNHWNWHLLTCSHVKNIKGPLSLNRQLESHKYDIDAPLTNCEAGTEHWNKTNTANLHISCVIKKKKKKNQFRGLEWRSFQSGMLLQMVRNQPVKTQTWDQLHRSKVSFVCVCACVCSRTHPRLQWLTGFDVILLQFTFNQTLSEWRGYRGNGNTPQDRSASRLWQPLKSHTKTAISNIFSIETVIAGYG